MKEHTGYYGVGIAVGSAVRFGSIVVGEILGNWSAYELQIPAAVPVENSAGRASGDAPTDVPVENSAGRGDALQERQ